MKAMELIGNVDEQHRVHAQVPTDIPAGQVRVVVFLPGEDEVGALWAKGAASGWSAELSDPREDIYTLDDGQPVTQPGEIYLARFPQPTTRLEGRTRP